MLKQTAKDNPLFIVIARRYDEAIRSNMRLLHYVRNDVPGKGCSTNAPGDHPMDHRSMEGDHVSRMRWAGRAAIPSGYTVCFSFFVVF